MTGGGWTGMAPGGSSARSPATRIGKTITPHTLRHAFIAAALDAGVPLRDVQEAASHADPRTTMRYDRARGSLDRHATYIVAAYVAGAADNPPLQQLRLVTTVARRMAVGPEWQSRRPLRTVTST